MDTGLRATEELDLIQAHPEKPRQYPRGDISIQHSLLQRPPKKANMIANLAETLVEKEQSTSPNGGLSPS